MSLRVAGSSVLHSACWLQASRGIRPRERCEAWPRGVGPQRRAAHLRSARRMPPQLSCTEERGNCQLLPAVGTTAQTKENCTKRSHRNRSDVCKALGAALVSAVVSALVSAVVSAAVPESAAVLESVQALELVRRAER